MCDLMWQDTGDCCLILQLRSEADAPFVCLQTDPEAAKIVFECGAPIVMLPVELTHTALVTPDVLNRISAELQEDTPFVQLIKQLLLYFADSYKTVFKFDNPPLHDPCAVAYVIAPELFKVCYNSQ